MKSNTLYWFYDMYAYKLRASPFVRLYENKYNVKNIAFDMFNKVTRHWHRFSLHRSSEKYYKVIDYHNDTINVFKSCNDAYLFILQKQKELFL